ncbi:TetR/AcrR family transcriptional regulator [Marinobacterium arenosum]|uniref:TetR/AcrR family transcriptional regulator n=1 Tax=Marinobacterium arenosum TaxID=2862496 RepID=UPI001C958871|nr:TetR/AcrR family transcriptional regulator [Marinobacterium arenosum]MBY4675197.1 TetR/AcrR family transcriptional regulator [Marinobacterium arenosum]
MATTKRQLTREKILNAAWHLFNQQGYQDTSTRQIARQAGVADGTVFSHFPTKLEMLKAGIVAQVDRVLTEAEQQDPGGSPAERLLHYAGYLYGYYADNSEFSRELFKETIWQHAELQPQIEVFKQRLMADRQDPAYAEIMIDCYFMTLLYGLNQRQPSASRMLERLREKLARLGEPNVVNA